MSADEAKELLMMHSFSHEDIENPKVEKGFLGSLRPYNGLCEHNFHEVMEAVLILAPYFRQNLLDREIMSALWGMCHYARAWGIHPDGMLKRNHLITREDSQRLEEWVEAISYAVASLLDGSSVDTAFEFYSRSASI